MAEPPEGVPAVALLNGAVHCIGPQLLGSWPLMLAHPDLGSMLQQAHGCDLDKNILPVNDPCDLLGGTEA